MEEKCQILIQMKVILINFWRFFMNNLFQFTEDGYLNKRFYFARDLSVLENDFVNLNQAKDNITSILPNICDNTNFLGNSFRKYDLRSIENKKTPKLKKTLLISLWNKDNYELIVVALFLVLGIYTYYYFSGYYPLEFIFSNLDKSVLGLAWGSLMECTVVFLITFLPRMILDPLLFKIFKHLDNKIPRSYDYVPDHVVVEIDKEYKRAKLANIQIDSYNKKLSYYKNLLGRFENNYKTFLKSKLNEINYLLRYYPEFLRKARKRERMDRLAAYENRLRQGAHHIRRSLINNVTLPFQCPYCENFEQRENIEADHIIPLVDGGLNRFQNIVLVCKDCNRKKSAHNLRYFCHRENFNYEEVCNRLESLNKVVPLNY